MNVTEMNQGWLESEKSLGAEGDKLFLETRHRILTAVYRPYQTLSGDRLAHNFDIPNDLGQKIITSLCDHGYIAEDNDGTTRIIGWSDTEFGDVWSTLHEFVQIAVLKNTERLDQDVIMALRYATNIDLSGEITASLHEAFQIRWWMYWHTLNNAVEIKSFRKMMLTGGPPCLRRRLLIALDSAGLRSMLFALQALTKDIEKQDREGIKAQISQQWQQFLPIVAADNSRYQDLAENTEVRYEDRSLPQVPIFRKPSDKRVRFGIGVREPLNWPQFLEMKID
jgi:hypothetical protein